jgi:hypothetical protein
MGYNKAMNKKIDLTWLMYLGYIVLLACSFDLLSNKFVTPAVWVLTAMLFLINLFLSLGVVMAFYAYKKIKENPSAIKMSIDKQQQQKFGIALLVEVFVMYLLMTSSLASEVNFIFTLVVAKIILTIIFLVIHKQIRKHITV